MGVLHLDSCGLAAAPSTVSKFNPHSTFTQRIRFRLRPQKVMRGNGSLSCWRIRAVGTIPEKAADTASAEEPPSIGFAFVSSVLFPDGTPDMHLRTATGGQKLRDIMLDGHIDLYGPYARALLNCAGGGTCATCMVEVIEGKELLNPRTDKEKEKLRKLCFSRKWFYYENFADFAGGTRHGLASQVSQL